MSRRILVLVAPLSLAAACGRNDASMREQAAPSASVITIGVAVAGCDDITLCEKECDSGSADRCRRLAAAYAFGRGVDRDEAHATALYVRACDMKDAAACVFAGQMHEYAHGVARDMAAAARFYERACDMQWAAGCYNFAIMVESGRGVPRNLARAGELYGVACRAGAKTACDKVRDSP
jgi:TPR repeat protein